MSTFRLILRDDLPWVRLGGAYFLMAAVVSLPMVGRSLIINQRLRLPPDVSTAFYMVTWLPSLAAPIFGRLTDMHAPSRRYIATAGLVIEAIFQFIYATGLVDSLGMLYVVAVPISMAHVAAQACVDGILVSGEGGGETGMARARQGAMVTFSVAGDIAACLISLLIQLADGMHAGGGGVNGTSPSSCEPEEPVSSPPAVPAAAAPPPPPEPPSPPVPPSAPWSHSASSLVMFSFTVTSVLCLLAALLVFLLPRNTRRANGGSGSGSGGDGGGISHGRPDRRLLDDNVQPVLALTEHAAARSVAADQLQAAGWPPLASVPPAPPGPDSEEKAKARSQSLRDSSRGPWRERLISAVGGRCAILAASVAVLYMLSPTSSDALSSYIYQDVPIPTSLLTAQQLSGLFGTLLGGCAVWWLDWPLSRVLPLGAIATSLSAASGLWLVAARHSIALCQPWGYATLLLQPFVSGFLGRIGFMPLYALGAAASTRAREGGAYGLVMAAQAGAGEASASISVALISAMHIGAPSADSPQRSWGRLPHLMVLCAICKLAAGPLAVLVWRMGRRRIESYDDIEERDSIQ